jgi:CubicO group peptidase (beta-lactamase class C family)
VHRIFLLITSMLLVQTNLRAGDDKIRGLIAQFGDPDLLINGEAIHELTRIGEPAGDELINALQDARCTVRECAAITLGRIAPAAKQSVPFLIASLRDSSANVRWYAALALGQYGRDARKAVSELVRLLGDRDEEVRWGAYIALEQIDRQAIQNAPQFAAITDTLDAMVPRFMQELHVPGVSICLIKDDEIGWVKGFGAVDAKRSTGVDSSTIFEACSMSKTVFACLALMLVDEGRLDLDKPLASWLAEEFVSEKPEYAGLVSARMILSHTSGMPNWRKGGEERPGPLPVYFKPGSKFSYSGEGIYYLQRVVERITGEPLATFAKRTLFDPLVLSSTSYIWRKDLDERIATGHDQSGVCLERKRYTHANAAYTLYTTPAEYARLMIAMLSPKRRDYHPLTAKMRKAISSPQVRVDTRTVIDRPGRHLGLTAHRGLGWAIDSTITHPLLYHSGSNQTGFRCYSQYNPEDGSGIVIMTNGANGGELWSRLISRIGDW